MPVSFAIASHLLYQSHSCITRALPGDWAPLRRSFALFALSSLHRGIVRGIVLCIVLCIILRIDFGSRVQGNDSRPWPCTFSRLLWVGPWERCSAECGGGVTHRAVKCVNKVNGGEVVMNQCVDVRITSGRRRA